MKFHMTINARKVIKNFHYSLSCNQIFPELCRIMIEQVGWRLIINDIINDFVHKIKFLAHLAQRAT